MIQSHTRYQQSMDAITSNSDHRRYKKWIYPLLLILIFTLCLFPFKAIAATLSATQLYRWNGPASENAYGFFVKKLSDNGGDLNNPRKDGIPDIVISDFCESYGCGAVYVYSGKDYSLIFQLTGTAESYVTDVGDLNSDGVSDLFVSEMVLNDTFYTSRARVYSGLDGSPIPWLDVYGDRPGDNFGVCLSSIGDITGDGIPDLLVGASDMDEGAQNGGYIVLFSGADGSRIGRIDNPQTGNLTAMFGHSVSEAGDVNGDGTPDFIVGAPGANPQGITEAGRAYVFSGRIDLNFPVIYKLNGENSYDRLGGCCGSTDSVGDLNNDGRTELAVPAQYADPGGRINAGSYYIFDGAAGTQYQRPDGQGPLRFDGENPGDMLGGMKYCECGWIAVVGDLNNDGYKDFMVGAPWADVNNDPDAGQVLIFSGYDASILLRIDNPDPNHYPHTFGVGGAKLGDLNGDGITEVIIGAPSYAYSNPEIGSAYIFSLGTPSNPPPTSVTQSWVRRYNGPDNSSDSASKVVMDASGNIYVTGSSVSTNGSWGYATVKYDPDGNQLWVARYNGTGNSDDYASSIRVDGTGNIYVTGTSYGIYNDYATVKYDPNGNQLWVARYDGGVTHEWANTLMVDGSGNIYVGGSSTNTSGNLDYATVKYDPNGNQLWVSRYDNGGTDEWANTLRVDSSGNVYVSGTSYNQNWNSDYAIVKYDPNGNQLWVARYDNGGTDEFAYALKVDGSGNVYVTGNGSNALGNSDYVTIKYASNGNQLWVARYDNGSNDYAVTLALDSSG